MNHILFKIEKETVATADPKMNNASVRNLWRGFTFGTSTLTVKAGAACRFIVGQPQLPTLPDDAEYIIAADERGLAVVARDYPSLMRGYAALLLKIDNVDNAGTLGIVSITERSTYKLKNRMVHFCIFPETDILMLRRYLRLSAILGYTHAVLEFWGSLQLDCLPALAWRDHSFAKNEIRDLICEMRELGIEPIPMFNQLGHASASRVSTGKHVVLDQDPSKYALFTQDGWSWNTFNPAARKLLSSVRAELYELFGKGEYFHAGLDESYSYNPPHMFETLPEYLGELTHTIAAEGRRPMIWMDMLLPAEAYGDGMHAEECSNKTPEACRRVIEALHPSTVLVDWQYGIKKAPVPTSLYLKSSGFDIMGAPWLNVENGKAHIDTAADNDLFGVMLTTWHTLPKDGQSILRFAKNFGAASSPYSPICTRNTETATLLRKVTFEPLTYEQTGWRTRQITLGSEQTL